MKTTYIKSNAVKKFLKEAGKQVSPDFLSTLDKKVYEKLYEMANKVKDKRLRAIHVEVAI